MRRRPFVARSREDWAYQNDGRLAPSSVSRHPGRQLSSCETHAQSLSDVLCFPGLFGVRCKRSESSRIQGSYGQPKVVRLTHRIAKILSAHKVSWIVFAIQETGYSKYTIAIGASWVATESNCEMLEHIFLAHQVEAVDTPKSLILTGRCGEDDGRCGY